MLQNSFLNMPMPIGRKLVQYRGTGEKCESLLLAGRRQRDKEGYQFVLKWPFFIENRQIYEMQHEIG